jgi:Uma2 family endonuclease
MASLADGRTLEEPRRADRSAIGADRYDEVWDGVYSMSPMPDLEHQRIGLGLATIFQLSITWRGLGDVFAGVNVTDTEENWTSNYRVPDVAVVLQGGRARDHGTYLCGGPDFLVEIESPNDRSREKLSFYSSLGVRELMLVTREHWSIQLFRLQERQLIAVGVSSLEQPTRLDSLVLPLSFQLVRGAVRPQIEVQHADGAQRWLV